MRSDAEADRVPVVIVGGGPVGLSLAVGLARHGVRSVLVEKKPTTSEYSKAPGIHIRTREIFCQWGIEQRFLDQGTLRTRFILHSVHPGQRPFYSIDFSELKDEADRPGLLILEQAHTERIVLQSVQETGLCVVQFGTEAVGLTQDDAGARLRVRHHGAERTIEAAFVAGCDGAGSFVRDALKLPFDGATYDLRPMLADVRIADDRDALDWPRVYNGRQDLAFGIRLSDGLWRLVRIERGAPDKSDDVPDDEVRQTLTHVLGDGPAEIVWASRFRIHIRSSPRFRVGRVLLAGDAAHVHSPVGGLGMNGGIQDAHNLAWKLAAALNGGDIDRLLDSYDVERRAVIVETVSGYTDFLTRVFLDSPAMFRRMAFFFFRALIRVPGLRKRMKRRFTMLDLDYPRSPLLDPADRSAGVRLPNPLLRAPDGTDVRLYDLLPVGPAIIYAADDRDFPADAPVERIIHIGTHVYRDQSGSIRRLLGGKDGWILVRPDAHVAFATCDLTNIDAAIRKALGLPAAAVAPAH